MEEGVESKNIDMAAMRLDLDLSPRTQALCTTASCHNMLRAAHMPQLVLDPMLDELALVKHFQSKDEACIVAALCFFSGTTQAASSWLGRQAQTDRQTDRQADRQMNRSVDR